MGEARYSYLSLVSNDIIHRRTTILSFTFHLQSVIHIFDTFIVNVNISYITVYFRSIFNDELLSIQGLYNGIVLTFTFAVPQGQQHSANFPPASEVHHPDGVVDIVVVQDGALVEVIALVAVHGQLGVAVRPVLPALALVVHPSRPLIRHVL